MYKLQHFWINQRNVHSIINNNDKRIGTSRGSFAKTTSHKGQKEVYYQLDMDILLSCLYCNSLSWKELYGNRKLQISHYHAVVQPITFFVFVFLVLDEESHQSELVRVSLLTPKNSMVNWQAVVNIITTRLE